MGAYDNPRIIEDLYGAKAWAEASMMLSKTLVGSVAAINTARNEAYLETRKRQEKINGVESRIMLNKNKELQGNIATFKSESGVTDTLVNQFQENGRIFLEGTEDQMGAIEAQTLLETDSSLTKKEKQNLQDIITRSDTYQTNMIQFAGKIKGNLDLINEQNQISIKDYYWEGETERDQIIAMLTGNFLDNQSLEGIVSSSTKNLETDYKTGGNKLVVEHKVKKDNKYLKGLFDDYEEDENGFITLRFEKNANTWDGELLKKSIQGVDIDTIANDTNITIKGKLNKDLMSVPLIGVLDSDGHRNYDHFVNVDFLNESFKLAPEADAQIEARILTADNNAQRDYITNVLEARDNIPDGFFEKPIKEQVELYKEWILTKMKRDLGLSGPGDQGNKLLPDQELIFREITKADAAIINQGQYYKDNPTRQVIATDEGYFIRTRQKERVTTVDTETAKWKTLQLKNIKDGQKQIYGMSGNKGVSIIKGSDGVYKQYKWVTARASVPGDSDAGLGSASVTQGTWQLVQPSDPRYVEPSSDPKTFMNFLGY